MSIVKNPLFSGGDPFLLYFEGTYYMYFTGGTSREKPGFVVYYTNYSLMIDSDISGIQEVVE